MFRTPQVVGRNVRRMRIARGLSVTELARRTELSRATLTELEAARANPTLDTVDILARELGTTASALLIPTQEDDIVLIRAGNGYTKSNGVIHAQLLQRIGVADGVLELWHALIDRSAQPQHAPAHPRGVTEQLYVLDGEVRAGPTEQPATLTAGDLLSWPADQPHLYHCLTQPSDVLIQMIYPPGSQEHGLVSKGMLHQSPPQPVNVEL